MKMSLPLLEDEPQTKEASGIHARLLVLAFEPGDGYLS